MEKAAAPLDVSVAYSEVAPPVPAAAEAPPVPVVAEAPPVLVAAEAPPYLLAVDAAPVPVAAEAPPYLPAAEAAPVPVAAPIPVVAQAALPKAVRSNRRMLVAALLVVAGGTLTFAMLRSSAPAVPVTTPAAKPGPVAPKAAPNAVAAAAAVPTRWRAANKEWLLNAKKGVAFELPSQNRVTIWQGIAQPMLVVRCDAGRLQAFVYTASAIQMEAIDENHTVRVSFDDEPEVTERWADSSDHDALFAPDSAAFARRLIAATKLTVGYKPHNAQRVVAEFQTAGLNDLIAPVAKQCGWTK